MLKVCIDCKWHEMVNTEYPWNEMPNTEHRCVCPWIREQDLVTGHEKIKYCRVERLDAGGKTTCGEDGKHWEAK